MTYLASQIGENEKRPKSEVQELERIMRSTKLQCAQNGASRLVPQKVTQNDPVYENLDFSKLA